MKASKILLVCTLLLSNLVCFAEGEPGFDDNVQDAPLPINQWVYVVLIIAIYYGYKSVMRAAKIAGSKDA